VKLRQRAYAKVNLCLFLGPRRAADQRHELVTVFESISLADELELTVLDGRGRADEVICPAVAGPNLVSEALDKLRACGWSAPPVRVEIRKHIPVAAGLGGGSADAAAALRLAHEVQPLPGGLAARLARELGADVPSQLEPGLWLGTGAGEVLEPLEALPERAFVIVPVSAALATAEVYREADRLRLGRQASELAALAANDLTPAARSLCPAIDGALEAVRQAGADHAFVCGSGPAAAGVWWGEAARDRALAAALWLRERYPAARAADPILAIGHNEAPAE
jgi:4-diphosphocytidyl-2-C-methyl-D-erythritol kinase